MCTDAGTSLADGASCGTNLVCKTGNCVSCTAGQACQPQNPCKNGMTSCTTGTMTCVETTNKTPGTLCGAGQSCAAGVLTLPAMCSQAGACSAATMQCTSGACNPMNTDCSTCPVGQMSCPAGCKDLSRDVLNCGTCGNVCPSPAPGTGIATCSGGQCSFSCNSGYLQCVPINGANVARCQQQVWDFEDQSLGGLRSTLAQSAVRGIGISTRQTHTGRYSLAVQIVATGQGQSRVFQIGTVLCGGQGFVPAKELNVMGWMMLEPADIKQVLGKASYFGMHAWTDKADGLVEGRFPGYNEWFESVTPVAPLGGEQLLQFAAEGGLAPDIIALPGDWTGTIYIDDILIK